MVSENRIIYRILRKDFYITDYIQICRIDTPEWNLSSGGEKKGGIKRNNIDESLAICIYIFLYKDIYEKKISPLFVTGERIGHKEARNEASSNIRTENEEKQNRS